MDLMEIAKSFGFPGLIVCVWYLLETQKGKRLEKVEAQKLAVEERKADAMTVGFQALASKIDTHQVVDIQSHEKMATSIARVESKLDMIHGFTPVEGVPIEPQRRVTPASGVPVGGYYGPHRPKTQGGR